MSWTMRGMPILATVLLVCAVALPATGFAQEAQDAQAYFEEGAAAYFQGKYAEALVQFKKAQDTVPNALFLYNIALCNLKLSRYREALNAALDAHRMGTLEPREATQNEARIDAIRTIETAMARGKGFASANAAATKPQAAVIATSQPPPEPQGTWGTLGWVGVGATTVGAGLLVGTLVVELGLQRKWDDYTVAGAAGDDAEYHRLKAEIEDGQQTGKILLLSGVGLAALGLTLIVVELVSGPEESVALHLGAGSAAVSGRF